MAIRDAAPSMDMHCQLHDSLLGLNCRLYSRGTACMAQRQQRCAGWEPNCHPRSWQSLPALCNSVLCFSAVPTE